MELYPAIDLREGRSVRLFQGDFAKEKNFGDPIEICREFVDQGAKWIHVVDLDAAKTGVFSQGPTIAEIVEVAKGVPVQVGGGVRDLNRAESLLSLGVRRVVVGTIAVENPHRVKAMVTALPGSVAIGLDTRDGMVSIKGWTKSSGQSIEEVLSGYVEVMGSIGALVVTEIGRDGTLGGPDFEGLKSILGQSKIPIVASGGVGTLEDLRKLAVLESKGEKLAGAIVGMAIHEGRFSVREAIEACKA